MQKFVITSGEHEEVQHGYVEAAGFSFGDEKTWYSNDRKVIAKIDRNVKSITEIVNAPLHVRDCNDQKMALVNEELVAGSLSQVTLISVADLSGRVVATSMAHGEHDAVVSLKDAGAGTVMTDIRKTTSFGDLTDSFAVHFAVQDGALGADPRVVLLALAAEVPPVAWGMGAAPFVLFLGFWLAVALFFCCRMCGTADTSDPRFGIFALFDNVADRSGEHGGYTDLRYGNTL